MKYIVFTDLDGTLIDHNTYSYESAIISLNLLKEHNIPLIFCTSKTRTEIEIYEKNSILNVHLFQKMEVEFLFHLIILILSMNIQKRLVLTMLLNLELITI